MVISGLALEIILKSFASEEVEAISEHISKYEYASNKKGWKNHNLIALLDNIPIGIKAHLFDKQDIGVITNYQNVFLLNDIGMREPLEVNLIIALSSL